MQGQGQVPVLLPVRATKPVDWALSARVVPSIGATGDTMEIKVDAQPIFPAPLDRPKQVPPLYLVQERVPVKFHCCPVPIRDAHVVEPSFLDHAKVVLRDERAIVLLQGLAGTVRAEVLRERVFVDNPEAGIPVVEQRRADERFQHKPAY